PCQDLGPIAIEFGGVEMTVAVEQHRRRYGLSLSAGIGGGNFRFFQLASSRVPNPNRISSANGMKSGISKSSTNKPAVIKNRVGKRSRAAKPSNGASIG